MPVSEIMVLAGAKALHEAWRSWATLSSSKDGLWEDLHQNDRASYLRDSRTVLTAALSDQVVGWQPIETALRHNGMFVDLWFPQRDVGEYGRVPDCQWIEKTTTPGWYAANDENDSMYYIGDGATHWRYRPESPPQPSEDNGADTNGGGA